MKTQHLSLPLALAAAALLYLGLGIPNHPYQIVLGLLTTALAYHRRWLVLETPAWHRVLPLLNALNLSLLLKLFIGSGVRTPFWWASLPALATKPGEGQWLAAIPSLHLVWNPTDLAGWQLDCTLVQLFLLIVTWLGVLFGLELFASVSLLALVAFSLPAFSSFNWDWVFPALLTSGIAFYTQNPIKKLAQS